MKPRNDLSSNRAATLKAGTATFSDIIGARTSGTYRSTQRMTVVWETTMPRSAIIAAKSR